MITQKWPLILSWVYFSFVLAATEIPAIPEIPDSVSSLDRRTLDDRRKELFTERANLRLKVDELNRRCHGVEVGSLESRQCNAEKTSLEGEVRKHSKNVADFTIIVLAAANRVNNLKAVHAALSAGTLPPFQPVLELYQYNRYFAKELVGDSENRCAIAMSLTLGLVVPQDSADASLQLLRKDLSGAADRYYIRAKELAVRLKSEKPWGEPLSLNPADARKLITGKSGILYIEHAYLENKTIRWKYGDHIDFWDRNRTASGSGTPFQPAAEGDDPWYTFPPDKAAKVWFWEIRE